MGHKIIKTTSKQKKRKTLKKRDKDFLCMCACLVILIIIIVIACGSNRRLSVRERTQLLEKGYPESMIQLLARNPETRKFVIDAPKNMNKEYEIDLTKEVKKGRIPLFLQWDVRWGYENYGSDRIAITGCGPTSLSMVLCGLSGDSQWDPLRIAKIAEEQNYYVEGSGTSWNFMTKGAEQFGLSAEELPCEEEAILTALKEDKPIICSMGPGDFTRQGHFIVLTGVNRRGQITICDSNSKRNSRKSWSLEQLMPQMKNLWSYTYTNVK